MRLAEKTTLVIGGTRGIGRGIVERFAREGAMSVFTGRDGAAGAAVVAAVRGAGGCARHVTADARDLDGLRAVVRDVAERHDGLDVLVNNAACSVPHALLDTTLEDYDLLMDLNVRAVFFAMKWAAEVMVQRRSGSIINICSTAATRGLPDRALYCGTKAAVLQMSRAAAPDVAGANVRINCISPGVVDTDQLRTTRLGGGEDQDARVAALGAAQPLGRIGRPADIAAAAVYLGSAESAWTTGVNLTVDGGGYL